MKSNLLNWEVLEKPIKLSSGEDITNGKALVRSDNNEVLEVVNSNYTPFRNEDLIKLVQQVANLEKIKDSDIKIIESRNGQRINVRLKLDYKLSVKDDVVSSHLFVQNSHGGFSSLKFGFGNLVLSCSNGLVVFKKTNAFNIFHNRSLYANLKNAAKIINNVKREVIEFNKFSNLIADKIIDDREQIVLEAINYVTNVDLSISKEEYLKQFTSQNEQYKLDFKWDSAKLMSEAIQLEMNNKGGNYWGLLNGFTYYNSHLSAAKNRTVFIVDGYGKVITDKAISFIRQKMGVLTLN